MTNAYRTPVPIIQIQRDDYYVPERAAFCRRRATRGRPDPVRFPYLLLLLLAIPLAEIAGFVVIGGRIGVLATIGLVLATALAGSILLRVQGLGILQRIRRETDAGRVPGREMVHGLMILVAGFLLLLPGFVTDAIGLLLFVPFIRDIVWKTIGARVVADIEIVRMGGLRGGPGRNRRTIDLDDADFRRTEDDPDRRIDDPRRRG